MQELLIYILLGLGIGVMSGFFGIGGGLILTPTLILLQISPVIAIATSLLYTIATSLSGVFAHFRMGNIKIKYACIIGVSGALATQVAHPFVLFLERYQVEDTIIPLIYLCLLTYFSVSLLKKGNKKKSTKMDSSKNQLFKIILIGIFAGFASTTLGIGGGMIIVPMLISILSFPARVAVGTSLMSIFIIVIAGFLSYSTSTPIDYKVSSFLIIGALIGGQLGALFTKKYEDKMVRRFLAGLYIIAGISLALKLSGLDLVGLLLLLLYCVFLLGHFTKTTITFNPETKEKQAS